MGREQLPQSLPACLRSTGAAQDLLHLGAFRLSSSLSHPGREQPLALSLTPAQHPWPARQRQHRAALLPHSCPCLCLCKLQELSPCVSATVTPESVTRALQTLVRGSINVNLHTLQFRCVLQLWTWQSLFCSLSPARNKDKAGSLQVWTGWGKTRASSWREMVPPCTQTSSVYVLSTKQDSSTLWAMSLYSPLMISTAWSCPLWLERKTLGWIINCVFSQPGTVGKRRETIPPTMSLLVSSCAPFLVLWETKKQFLEPWSAQVLRSTAVVISARGAHSLWNVIFIPPTSCAFIYCLMYRHLCCSLHCQLDAVSPEVCCFQTVCSRLHFLRTEENL